MPKHSGIRVRVLGSSLRLTEASGTDLDEFLLFGQLTESLRAPYIRVYGGWRKGDSMRAKNLRCEADAVTRIRETRQSSNWCFDILLKTHSAFSNLQYCQGLKGLVPEP